jgi:hypothetical protein
MKNKRKMNIGTCLLFLVVPFLFPSGLNGQKPSSKGIEPVLAEIKFSNGTQKTVEAFRREIVSHAMYSQIRTDIPQTTYTYRDNLSIEIGPYEIEIPFKIIKKVTFEFKKGNNEYDKYLSAKVLLGNDTELEGRVWAQFKGKTSLGETSFKIRNDMFSRTVNIEEIVFKHNALNKYEAPSFGKHGVDLFLENGTVVSLKAAGFMKQKVNDNGCYIDDVYSEKLQLKISGEGDYELEWGKIASLVHENPAINLFSNVRDYSQLFKLITKDGQENIASCQLWLNAVHDIKATANVNTDYNLLVIVPLYKKHYSKLILK